MTTENIPAWKVREFLELARKRIEQSEHWTTGTEARTEHNEPCNPWEVRAAKWCAVGALIWVNSTTPEEELYNEAVGTLNECAHNFIEIDPEAMHHSIDNNSQVPAAAVNDVLGHARVLELYDDAIKVWKDAEEDGE